MDPLTDFDILLQTEITPGVFRCLGFTGVPAAGRSWICITSSGGETLLHGQRLTTELEAVLLGSSPSVKMTEFDCPAAPDTFSPADYPKRRKVLVLLGSVQEPIADHGWIHRWDDEQHDASVMTVLPAGPVLDMLDASTGQDPTHLLRRVNASQWQSSPAEALAGIMARADITTSASRVFISYRRLETQPLAVQLFDRLTHEGFDVFLDRFSIPEGLDFQRRLLQELEDKSMVVLLESKFLKDSPWTQHEIDFVKVYRLGLATIRMPDVHESDRQVSTTIGTHLDLQASDFVRAPRLVPRSTDANDTMLEWPEVHVNALNRLAGVVKQAHASALFERRYRLRNDVRIALRKVGLETDSQEVGPIFVTGGTQDHLIWITTRPPTLEDFQGIHHAHVGRWGPKLVPRGLIVGPRAAQEPDRLARLDWLRTVTESISFDEARLDEFAQRVASQTWA